MSKTQEELWSRFRVTNYQGNYLEEWEVSKWKNQHDDLDLIFAILEIQSVVSEARLGLAEIIIHNVGNVFRRLGNPKGNRPVDANWTYGDRKATKWIVAGDNSVINDVTIPTNYELVFAKTSELLSGSGWVGNFWLVEGYFFSFSEGFSNMAGVIIKDGVMQILLGEQAYKVYREKIQQHQWDAINRRLI